MTGAIHLLSEECISGRSSRIYREMKSVVLKGILCGYSKCVLIFFIRLEQNVP